MTEPTTNTAAELIPLSERLRYLWLFRVCALLVVFVFGLSLRDTAAVSTSAVVVGTAAYLLLVVLMETAWRVAGARRLRLFAAVLIVDAVYLAWIAYAADDPTSPLYYLRFVQLIVVALLASYRTGVRLAFWHSALALLTYYWSVGDLPGPQPHGELRPYSQLVGFVCLFWLVTLATATFSAINERELRRRRYDLEALARFSDSVEAAESPHDVAQLYLEALADTFNLRRLVLIGGAKDDLSLLAAVGGQAPSDRTFQGGAGSLVRRTHSDRRAALVAGVDPSQDPWLDAILPAAGNLIVAPLCSEKRAIGVAVVEHSLPKGSRVEQRVVATIERFTAHAALALENAWLLEQVRQSAATDGLTGIANRRHFDMSLDTQIARAIRSQETASLLLIDIDHFKRLNDEHGHQVGDDVLRRVAEIIAIAARTGDIPARYGGEEFAVILSATDVEQAELAAERLRVAIATADLGAHVTVSIGLATFPHHGANPVELIRAADQALYQAKNTGRNRVVAASGRVTAGVG
jgi:diguanylate cyclase (GGDEF)-like protein